MSKRQVQPDRYYQPYKSKYQNVERGKLPGRYWAIMVREGKAFAQLLDGHKPKSGAFSRGMKRSGQVR